MADADVSGDDASDDRWTKVSIRIASKRLTADEIQTAVGDAPTAIAERGDPVSRHSPQAGVHKSAWCSYDCPLPSGGPAQGFIDWLTEFIARHVQALDAVKGECEIDVRISFSSSSGQGGFTLDGPALAMLGRFDVHLHLDLYPPGQ